MTSQSEYYKRIKEQMQPTIDSEIARSNEIYANQKQTVSDAYKNQENETKSQYEDLYRQNAVQKEINRRQIAENMANMGLTDSGLNRTQQTAVQLSYANQNAKLSTQMQKAIDSLALSMNERLTTIENNRLNAENSIRSAYEKTANEQATKLYDADVKAETERQKAYYSALAKVQKQAQEDNYKILYNADTVNYKKNSDEIESITYSYTDKNGNIKTRKVRYGVNPYTNNDNLITYKKEIEKYGAWNGYQPKGITINGKIEKLVSAKDSNNKVIQTTQTGKLQTVWSTGTGSNTRYWLWDGSLNKYVEAANPFSQKDGLQ